MEDRVKQLEDDLGTIRQAMRCDKPYARDDLPLCFLLALAGPIAFLLVQYTAIEQMWCFIIAFLPALLLFAKKYFERREQRAVRPALFREMKLSLIALGIGLPLMLIWIQFAARFGIPSIAVRASLAVFVGATLFLIGVLDELRRVYLIVGVLIAGLGFAGVAFPNHLPIICAILVTVSGLSSAIFIYWRLRRDEATASQ